MTFETETGSEFPAGWKTQTVAQFATHQLSLSGFKLLEMNFRQVVRVKPWPIHHGDRSDRLLIVQDQLDGLTLVTKGTTCNNTMLSDCGEPRQ
jgi:PIN domain nuclease of toxin-antitoxin system